MGIINVLFIALLNQWVILICHLLLIYLSLKWAQAAVFHVFSRFFKVLASAHSAVLEQRMAAGTPDTFNCLGDYGLGVVIILFLNVYHAVSPG